MKTKPLDIENWYYLMFADDQRRRTFDCRMPSMTGFYLITY